MGFFVGLPVPAIGVGASVGAGVAPAEAVGAPVVGTDGAGVFLAAAAKRRLLAANKRTSAAPTNLMVGIMASILGIPSCVSFIIPTEHVLNYLAV